MSVCFMLLRLFIVALWSTAGKGLTSWLLFVMFNCVFVTFPCGILGQVWYLIISNPDLCRLSYFLVIVSIPDLCCLSYFAVNPSNPAYEFSFPTKYVDLNVHKPKVTRGVQYVMKTAQYIPKFYINTIHNYFH